ncbi:MAG: hypothetical protein JWM34_1304 [Ilumatobacteraceae bacterium]|nr:hypothetical protein [Ilumatobacteraceae bacterium]
MITTSPRRSRRLLLCGAIALGSIGFTSLAVTGVANAAPAARQAPAVHASDAASCDATPSTDDTTVTDDSTGTDDNGTFDTTDDSTVTEDSTATDDSTAGDDGDWGNWSDDTSWIAASNAEQDQLGAYLTAHGIAYTTQVDDSGEGDYWVVVDDTDQAANDAIDDFYWQLNPTPQADIDAANADTDALTAYMQAHGVAVTVTTDRHGYRNVDWNYDDPTAEGVYEDYEWTLYPTSPADIASMNADTEAENAYLVGCGFTATITADKHGIETDTFDQNDEAIWTALDNYWSSDAYQSTVDTTPGE